MDAVQARGQQAPVFAALRRADGLVLQSSHVDIGVGDRVAAGILHQTLDADVRLAQQLQQRALVALPLLRQGAGGRELAAGQLNGQLEAVAEGVVEVLHAAGQLVPVGAVGDAAGEAVVAVVALAHDRVVVRVGVGQLLEHPVVRGQALLAALVVGSGSDESGSVINILVGREGEQHLTYMELSYG